MHPLKTSVERRKELTRPLFPDVEKEGRQTRAGVATAKERVERHKERSLRPLEFFVWWSVERQSSEKFRRAINEFCQPRQAPVLVQVLNEDLNSSPVILAEFGQLVRALIRSIESVS